MGLGLGPLPVLKTFCDKEPFSRCGGINNKRVIVPWAGRRNWVIEVSGSDARLPSWTLNRRAHFSGLQLGLVHRFWTILDRILAGFIGLAENFLQRLHLGHPV